MGDTWRGEETSRLNQTYEISSRNCTRMDATWTHRSLDLHLTAVTHRDCSLIGRSRSSIYLRSIERCRQIVEEPYDRGAIEPRSYSFRRGIIPTRSNGGRPRSRTTIDARSWPDRATIRALFEAKFKPISLRNWSRILAKWNRSHDPCKTPPRLLQWPTIVGPISPFKSMYFPSLKGIFDRFVKELSEFRRRSLVPRDPPAFRLNSEEIGAGLITNSSLISSNFPLEFRKSVRKDPSKFTPIRAN